VSTYKEIVGQKITKVSSDPGEPKTGQMWYNTTTGTLRGLGIIEAFSSGSSLATARAEVGSAQAGTQTAALAAGGQDTAPSVTAITEEYNGSGWSSGGSLNTARMSTAGGGTQTAAYVAAGQFPNKNATENYDGTSWTTSGTYPITAHSVAGMGTQTAGLAAGGRTPAPAVTNVSAEYDGSTWTAGNNINTSRQNMGGTGPQTAGIVFGGRTGPTDNPTDTEVYDGTSWSETANLNTGRNNSGSSGISSSSAFVAGGATQPPTTVNSAAETWDGTAWTTSPATLATARYGIRGAGTTSAGVFYGGYEPSISAITEEFNRSTNTITAAAWASGTAINTARNSFGGFGLQTANIIAGGYGSPNVKNETEEWDGTSWTEKSNLNTARSHYAGSQAGPYTAVFITKGNTSASDTSTNATEEWDGSSWTTVTANPTTGQRNMGAGTQTAGLSFGGLQNPAPPAPRVATTQEYDGTNWTSGGDLNTARNDGGGTGTQTAGLAYGGDVPGASAATEEYNGTAWTSVNNMAIASGYYGECGQSQTDAMAVGNLYASPDNGCQHYDGTTWATRPLLGTARFDSAGSGTGTAAMVAGGGTPGNTNAVEEFTGETTATNITDFTTS
jgi:hypothetical protein